MKLIKKTAYLLGNVLIKIYPDKADKLSKDRITLIHKDKKNLSITERLIRYALVRKLEKLIPRMQWLKYRILLTIGMHSMLVCL